jgi:hypothetical protein
MAGGDTPRPGGGQAGAGARKGREPPGGRVKWRGARSGPGRAGRAASRESAGPGGGAATGGPVASRLPRPGDLAARGRRRRSAGPGGRSGAVPAGLTPLGSLPGAAGCGGGPAERSGCRGRVPTGRSGGAWEAPGSLWRAAVRAGALLRSGADAPACRFPDGPRAAPGSRDPVPLGKGRCRAGNGRRAGPAPGRGAAPRPRGRSLHACRVRATLPLGADVAGAPARGAGPALARRG